MQAPQAEKITTKKGTEINEAPQAEKITTEKGTEINASTTSGKYHNRERH